MENKKEKRKRGFTLIELLAVIIILGILMIIAVPAVTKYINDSRKSSYISSAKSIIEGTTKIANNESLNMTDEGTTYYIPVKYIDTSNDHKTPYGEFTEAYVGVVTDGKSYQYYWVSNDTSKQGIKNITNNEKLEIDLIEGNLNDSEIRTTVEETGINDRNRILILNMDGTWQEERIAKYNLNEDGELEPADTLLAIFIPGEEFNVKVKELSGATSPEETTVNTNIRYIKLSPTEPIDSNKQERNIVSTSDSEVPIYAWFDNDTLYWWSEDKRPNLNVNAGYMFSNLQGLKDIQDIKRIKTDLTKNMRSLFRNCISLESIDVSRFDTSNVRDMNSMFYVNHPWDSSNLYTNLKTIKGLENFDTRNVTTMASMFYGQIKLTSLDLSSFNTENVVYMTLMFSSCTSLTNLDLSSFNTSNVINMRGMFQHTTAATSFDLRSFDTSKVTDMSYMFGCGGGNENCNLTEIKGIEKFDTSSLTTTRMMFVHQTKLRVLDLSSFDTSNVTNTQGMFGATNLVTIYASPKFVLGDTVSSDYMFTKRISGFNGISDSYVLTGGAGTTYSTEHTNKEYARIDDPANNRPGYFTLKTN